MLRRDALIAPSQNDVSLGVIEGLCSYDIRDSRRAIGQMRAAAPLNPDLQTVIDDAVVRVGTQGLVLIQDLRAAGLVRPLPGWLGIMQLGYDRINETGYAQRSMEIDIRGERQVPDRSRAILPVFATHDDFSFGPRELANAARVGTPLETDTVENATRNVNMAFEDQGWNGWVDANGDPITVAGNAVPGIFNSPFASFPYTGTNPAWDHASKTGAEIVNDVLGMLAMAADGNKYGPFNFYMGTAYWSALSRNYSDGITTFETSILNRLRQIPGGDAGGGPINFRHAPTMPANRTALIQMTTDTIDLVEGQQPAEVSWSHPLGRRYFLVLGCEIVRVKTDYNNASGIVIGGVE